MKLYRLHRTADELTEDCTPSRVLAVAAHAKRNSFPIASPACTGTHLWQTGFILSSGARHRRIMMLALGRACREC